MISTIDKRIKVEPSSSIKIKKILLFSISFLFLVFVLFLSYFPLILISLISFSTDKQGFSMPGLTLEWYKKIFEDGPLRDSISYTLRITFSSTIISTILGTVSAIGINSLNARTRKKFIILNNVPILNADIVTGVLLLIVFQIVGLVIGKNLLGFTTTLIAHVLFSTPYVVLSVLPKISEIDNNMYDAALDLGCSPFEALKKVIIPSISSGIISGALLAFTMSIDDFIISYFVTGEQGNFSIWLYSNLKTLRNGQWNQACAYNTLLMFVTITLVIGYQIYLVKKTKKGE